MYGIYDLQKRELRDEQYNTYEQALHSFADYWREINLDSEIDAYEGEPNLTASEKAEIVREMLNKRSDYDIIADSDFEIVQIPIRPWYQFKLDHPTGEYTKTYKNYEYTVLQHPMMGHLCGYVDTQLNTNFEDFSNIECHGGITYDNGTEIGFDCAHSGDMTPFSDEVLIAQFGEFFPRTDIWRTPEFVENECKHIIDQLIERKAHALQSNRT